MVVHGMFVCGEDEEGEAGLGLGINVDISAHYRDCLLILFR